MMYMSSVLKILILFYACSSRFCMHTIDAQRYNNKMNNRKIKAKIRPYTREVEKLLQRS